MPSIADGSLAIVGRLARGLVDGPQRPMDITYPDDSTDRQRATRWFAGATRRATGFGI